jgi:peptidoglycan/xylan/chitin deacetylase (PgdA/CDA1 family)
MTTPPLRFPGGRRFAFTIFDDCDNATVKNTRPLYRLLERLGMRTTTTVWPLESADVHPDWTGSSTLADPEYREFAQDLQSRGFEIAFHGASMMSAPRERTEEALEIFRATFGRYPRAHANHGSNRDSLYWSSTRFRSRLLQWLYDWRATTASRRSEGHLPGSPYFWGDLCRAHIDYVRAFTFPVTNVLEVHPNILYRDPACAFVNFWFSATHVPTPEVFETLFTQRRLEALSRGGVCIVATHGAGFTRHGEVRAETRRLLELLAAKNGWFVPVSTLLDYLRVQGLGRVMPARERMRLELRWLFHAVRRGVGQ